MARQEMTSIIYDKKGRVLSIGKNSYTKTHTLQAKHSAKVGTPERIFMHSECNAVVKCKALHKAYRIKVFRYGKNGKALLAKPCAACMSLISETPIEVIEWTVTE